MFGHTQCTLSGQPPHLLLIVPPQRELWYRPHPRSVPPKREGPWRYHHGLAGHYARARIKAHQGEAEEGHSPLHRAARRASVARAGHAASLCSCWQLWLRSFVRLTHSSPHALHTDDGKTTTVRPSVRLVYTSRIARSVEPTQTCTAMTAASRIHQCLRLLREYHLLSLRPISFMRKPNDRPTQRHGLTTTPSRRHPQVKRRWILSWGHRHSTESTQRMVPTPGADLSVGNRATLVFRCVLSVLSFASECS